jgi:hypothetical protein
MGSLQRIIIICEEKRVTDVLMNEGMKLKGGYALTRTKRERILVKMKDEMSQIKNRKV